MGESKMGEVKPTKTDDGTRTVIKQWNAAASDAEREATGEKSLPFLELIYVEFPDGDNWFEVHLLDTTFDSYGFDAYWSSFQEAHTLAKALK